MLRLPVRILKLIHKFGEGFSQQKLRVCPPGTPGLPSIYLAQLSAQLPASLADAWWVSVNNPCPSQPALDTENGPHIVACNKFKP